MRGVSNRTKLNVARTEQDLWRVVSEVNRLPFGFVGATVTAANPFSTFDTDWVPVLLSATVDLDRMVASSGQSATLPSGADGVYQFVLNVQVSGGTGEFRVLHNDTAVITAALTAGVPASRVSAARVVEVGDVVAWQFRAPTSSTTLNAGSSVSFHRLGLLP